MQQQLLLFDIGEKRWQLSDSLLQWSGRMVVTHYRLRIRPCAQLHQCLLVSACFAKQRRIGVAQRMEGYHLLSFARNACACGLINQTL